MSKSQIILLKKRSMYYNDKKQILKDLFGATIVCVESSWISVDNHKYPIVDDVIILLDPWEYPSTLDKRIEWNEPQLRKEPIGFAEDIQFTFGEEWKKFSKVMPEHEKEFQKYFDLVDLSKFKDLRICDLGCGIGRWSFFLSEKCREIVLVDFSDAIFVARRNLIGCQNALFFMGNMAKLPFRNDFADFIFCLGVLHHLPNPALDAARALHRYAPQILIYLYYALDNRPFYFITLFSVATGMRRITSAIRNPIFRNIFTTVMTLGIYLPMIALGTLLQPFGFAQYVPLFETYKGKSIERIRQDVYDRFFTGIEQRYNRRKILELKDTFSRVVISEQMPYWHFICER